MPASPNHLLPLNTEVNTLIYDSTMLVCSHKHKKLPQVVSMFQRCCIRCEQHNKITCFHSLSLLWARCCCCRIHRIHCIFPVNLAVQLTEDNAKRWDCNKSGHFEIKFFSRGEDRLSVVGEDPVNSYSVDCLMHGDSDYDCLMHGDSDYDCLMYWRTIGHIIQI